MPHRTRPQGRPPRHAHRRSREVGPRSISGTPRPHWPRCTHSGRPPVQPRTREPLLSKCPRRGRPGHYAVRLHRLISANACASAPSTRTCHRLYCTSGLSVEVTMLVKSLIVLRRFPLSKVTGVGLQRRYLPRCGSCRLRGNGIRPLEQAHMARVNSPIRSVM